MQTESERMEKYIPCKWEAKESIFYFQKKVVVFFTGVSILISDKIDLKLKKITRDNEGHYILTEGSIQAEDVIIVNISAPT